MGTATVAPVHLLEQAVLALGHLDDAAALGADVGERQVDLLEAAQVEALVALVALVEAVGVLVAKVVDLGPRVAAVAAPRLAALEAAVGALLEHGVGVDVAVGSSLGGGRGESQSAGGEGGEDGGEMHFCGWCWCWLLSVKGFVCEREFFSGVLLMGLVCRRDEDGMDGGERRRVLDIERRGKLVYIEELDRHCTSWTFQFQNDKSSWSSRMFNVQRTS